MQADINQQSLSAPLYVVWELNHLCNARCLHCYSDSGPDVDEAGMMTREEVSGLIDEFATLKVAHVGVSGGEPLLRPDCVDIVTEMASRGLVVSVSTNGRKLTRSTAQRLAESGVDSVCLSLDSHRPERHDWIRSSPGLFARAMLATEHMRALGLPFVIGMTAMKYNYEEIEDMVALALRVGASSLNITGYVAVGRGTLEHDLTGPQLRAFLEKTVALAERHEGELAIMWHDCRFALMDEKFADYAFKGCGAGNTACRVTFDGKVTPCSTLPLVAGDLRERSFTEIWRDSQLLSFIRDRHNFRAGTNCAGCAYLKECGGCRSIAYAYTGDPFAGNPHCWIEAPRDGAHLPVLSN